MTYTPQEHLEVRNRSEAAAMGLPWTGKKWGALLCLDGEGRHVTLITDDIRYHRMLVGAGDDIRSGLDIPPGKYPLVRPGWPGDPDWLGGGA